MQPFRFHSIYQPRIWGGQSMRTMLGRELPDREQLMGKRGKSATVLKP